MLLHTHQQTLPNLSISKENNRFLFSVDGENTPISISLGEKQPSITNTNYCFGVKDVVTDGVATGEHQVAISLDNDSVRLFKHIEDTVKQTFPGEKVSPLVKYTFLKDEKGDFIKWQGQPVIDGSKQPLLNAKCQYNKKDKKTSAVFIDVHTQSNIEVQNLTQGFNGVFLIEMNGVHKFNDCWYIGVRLVACIVHKKDEKRFPVLQWLEQQKQ